MQSENKKVLLRIKDLKQWFPLGHGKYVKANDGISIDIYEGETFGLVGESGCGKSTLGRTILQVYKQTDGRTMYYGRNIDEMAPAYYRQTIRKLPSLIKKMHEAEAKREKFNASYEALPEAEQLKKNEEYRTVNKNADDAVFEVSSVVGGFAVSDDLPKVQKQLLKIADLSSDLKKIEKKKNELEVQLQDLEYNEKEQPGKFASKIEAQKEKIASSDKKIESIKEELKKEHEAADVLKETVKGKEDFDKYESMLDNGVDLARLTTEEMRELRRDLQLIFQDPYSSLNPRMSVGQIIGEGLFSHGFFKKNSPRMQDEILHVMDMCGLAPYFVHRYPHQFSGGQRQRIGIARSLATRPNFIVCDEAVSALDVSIQSQIINLLSDLKESQNLTYLFITHDLSVVKYISDRIGVMYLGNMVELADSQELFDHPLHPYTEALLGAIPTTDVNQDRELQILEGDIPSPVDPPKGCKFHTRCQYCTEECKMVTPEWKEVRPNHFVACHHMLEKNL